MTASSSHPAAGAWIKPAAAAALALALGACAGKKEIFPQDLDPMTEVYANHFKRTGAVNVEGARAALHGEDGGLANARATLDAPAQARPVDAGGGESPAAVQAAGRGGAGPASSGLASPDYTGYTRTAERELGVLFPRLPNSSLVLYVYPHLTAAGAGVPGYATRFQMYAEQHYARPGEAHTTNTNPYIGPAAVTPKPYPPGGGRAPALGAGSAAAPRARARPPGTPGEGERSGARLERAGGGRP